MLGVRIIVRALDIANKGWSVPIREACVTSLTPHGSPVTPNPKPNPYPNPNPATLLGATMSTEPEH